MTHDVEEFIQTCIHCIISQNSNGIPRPLLTVLQGEKPNEVVHADFLYMGSSNNNNVRYIFLIKNDFSTYSWLHPCDSADSEFATNAIAKWTSCFGSMQWLVADHNPYFTVSFRFGLTNEKRIRNHFTTTYCLRANETIENLC